MITDPQRDLPEFSDVQDAADRLRGIAVHTPLLRSDAIDELLGVEAWFKPECLQRTGSFKIRGAWNRISRIPDEDRPSGVVAFSSGNHAQGVAAAARRMGIPATIVMPSDAPGPKIEATCALGAKIRLYDRATEDREAIGAELCSHSGATLIRPFDDAYVIAGQATATLEAVIDAEESGVQFHAMLCPAGGGGLLAGASVVLSGTAPACRLFAAEPLAHNDHQRSLAADAIVENAPGFHSIADALLAPRPGDLTFAINRTFASGGMSVSDEQLRRAMKLAFTHLKVVLEPGGACAFGALLETPRQVKSGGPVLVMLSGGNVDPETFSAALSAPL